MWCRLGIRPFKRPPGSALITIDPPAKWKSKKSLHAMAGNMNWSSEKSFARKALLRNREPDAVFGHDRGRRPMSS